MKASRVLYNLSMTDVRSKATRAVGRNQFRDSEPIDDFGFDIEWMQLMFQGCTDPREFAYKLDMRRHDRKKVHIWPGCHIAKKLDNAPCLTVKRFSKEHEDRAKLIHSWGMWCRKCNPKNEVLPMSDEQPYG